MHYIAFINVIASTPFYCFFFFSLICLPNIPAYLDYLSFHCCSLWNAFLGMFNIFGHITTPGRYLTRVMHLSFIQSLPCEIWMKDNIHLFAFVQNYVPDIFINNKFEVILFLFSLWTFLQPLVNSVYLVIA